MEIRGRPKTNPDVKALALKNSKHAMERIIELIDDEDPRVAHSRCHDGFGERLNQPQHLNELALSPIAHTRLQHAAQIGEGRCQRPILQRPRLIERTRLLLASPKSTLRVAGRMRKRHRVKQQPRNCRPIREPGVENPKITTRWQGGHTKETLRWRPTPTTLKMP